MKVPNSIALNHQIPSYMLTLFQDTMCVLRKYSYLPALG